MKSLAKSVITSPDLFDELREVRRKATSSMYVELAGTGSLLMRSEKWVLTTTKSGDYQLLHRGQMIPLYMLRWAIEYFFLEMDAPKELQVLWDKKASKYVLEKTSAALHKGQIPILRLFPLMEPSEKPLGIYGVCYPPRDEYDMYNVCIYANLDGNVQYLGGPMTIFD